MLRAVEIGDEPGRAVSGLVRLAHDVDALLAARAELRRKTEF
jgi:hypothetical protein